MNGGYAAACLSVLSVASLVSAAAATATPESSAADANGLRYVSYSGTAVARHSNKFLYSEQHVVAYKDGRLLQRVVLYACRNGSAFARKTASYQDPLAPDFEFEDVSTGMREGVRSDGSNRTVYFRANRVYPEKVRMLPPVPGLVVDSGFDGFIQANWSSLLTGEAVRLPFLVPSRLEELNFQLQHMRTENIGATSVEVFRLRLANVIGAVLPAIEVSYDSRSHVLMRYDGVSDLHDKAGDNFQTQIDFQPSDRQVSGEAADRAARHVPLVPCR